MSGEATNGGHQILWDGQIVWVNSGEDGSSIGRFSRVSTDVHLSATEQMRTGKQCLECYQDQTMHGWLRFCDLMKEHYGVTVPAEARPKWLGITGMTKEDDDEEESASVPVPVDA